MTAIIRTGGISIGGTMLGGPSAAGKWSPGLGAETVDFDRDKFAKLIADHGYFLTWEKAALCPNTPNTGLGPRDHDINCKICDGTGFYYFDPQCATMLMQGIRLDQSYHAYGRWDVGQQMVTAMPDFTISYFDRLTLSNGVARFMERVTRQPDTDTDKLRYAPLAIEIVVWVGRTGAVKVFYVDTDFIISADGSSIQWMITSDLPDANDRYSVSYRYRPRYVVLDLVHQHRDQAVEGGQRVAFPVQAVAKLDFLIRDVGRDAPATREEDPFPK
jgi:hypothetical protein